MTNDEIEQALRAENLDIRMDVDPGNSEHKWFILALDHGRQLCKQSGKPLNFTLNCDNNIQAFALYRSNLVVVSAGCIDFLCRLADRIVAKGMYPHVGSTATPSWTPSAIHSTQTIRALIRQEPFVSSKAVWLDDPERESLFSYLLVTLFRLVVLHEIGHFHHQHGKRFTDNVDNLDVDSAQPKLLPEAEAIASQARELVADKFAYDLLIRLLENEITALSHVPEMQSFARLYLDTFLKRTGFILQVAYLYFVATDRLPNADPESSVRMSHPPAPFRMFTIVATAQTGMDDQASIQQINAMAISAEDMIAVALDRMPNVNWLAQLDKPEFTAHYEKLYSCVDTWAITPQKAPVSVTNPL